MNLTAAALGGCGLVSSKKAAPILLISIYGYPQLAIV